MRYIIICLLFIGCNKFKSNEDLVFNTKTSNVDFIKKNGYEWRNGIGLLVYEKRINDTLINLYYDEESKKVYLKTWKIKLDFHEFNKVHNLLLNYNVSQITPVGSIDGQSDYYFFAAGRSTDNSVYICNVRKEKDISYLDISYYVPK